MLWVLLGTVIFAVNVWFHRRRRQVKVTTEVTAWAMPAPEARRFGAAPPLRGRVRRRRRGW